MMPQSPGHEALEVTPSPALREARPFNPFRLIGFVLLMLLCLTVWLRWYTAAVSMPRYCDRPADTLHYLEKVLTESRPAEEQSRRPYIIAAKLLYIIPQQREEPVQEYLQRLKIRIAEQCR